MYALLEKSQIKVGPRQYALSFFKEYLDKKQVQFDLPFDFDGDKIVINEDMVIVKVSEPIMPSYNPISEQLAGPYWDVTVEPITGYYDVADRSIDVIKNTLKGQLAAERYRKEVSGVNVSINGQDIKIDTARDERNIWLQSLLLLPDNTTQKFKFGLDLWIDLTKDNISMIAQSIVSHVQGAFDWESTKLAEIDAANSKEQLETIVIVEPKAPI